MAAAAYRCAERLTNERDGITHDFTHKAGVEHNEIVLPDGVKADWAGDRSALWNAAEHAEKRKDARVARELEIALPHELSSEGRIEAVRAFAQVLADRYGAAVDFAIHAPHQASDVRNHHAHLMMTTRQVREDGLGGKTILERENKWLLANGRATTDMQLRDLRQRWEGIANERLATAGLDVRIDHRSHMDRGLEIEPTEHVGVHATQMQRQGMGVERARLDAEAAQRNADLIREKPEQVLTIITAEKSVFDRRDIARTLHRYINDDVQTFQNAFAVVMASPALVELHTGEVELAKYSTREMVNLESGMARSAERMADDRSHGVDRRHVAAAIGRQDTAIQKASGDGAARLSDEQRQAIQHVTGPERISAVVGFAGAGKSTMLAAAREAWEAQGYRVNGAALSGKAAEGLEESSGIESRTLASWSRGWERDRGTLSRGDVFVIDEAGMVGSRQLAGFIGEAEQRGAKIVLVGDHEQLQAIGAGAPFRAIAERIGHAELSEIRRQREGWQREASVSFATHKTADGLAAYRDHGDIHFAADGDAARAAIVRDYLADRENRPDGSRVAMAHRRVDVRAINDAIRSGLQERGELARVTPCGPGEGELSIGEGRAQERVRALTYQTNDGKRDFAEGDRIVFLENDRDLGVKNGMLGKVLSVEQDAIQVQLDGRTADQSDIVSVPVNSYQAIDHGYATTIHKNQGATVDRAFVLASGTMDRHLTYVAMTRHRDGAQLYADRQEFTDKKAGQLVAHGVAPYEHKQGNRDSYFVTLENANNERSTTWGVDLGRAMAEASPEIGATIGLRHEGSVPVSLPDGTETHRNGWRVQGATELAYDQLESRLSRSGAKETTLDYTRDFAERRGIAEAIGVRSEIDLAGAVIKGHEAPSLATTERAVQDRSTSERSAYEERTPSQAGPERVERAPRRGMFDGLKLKPGGGAAQTERPAREGEQSPDGRGERDRLADRVRSMSGFEQAVDRYAQAYSSVDRQVGQKLPVLDTQKQAYRAAAADLDQVRPGSHALVRSALQYDPQTAQAMTQLSGRERVGQLVAGMDRERALQADPNVRADRFIERWNELRSERQALRGWNNDEARGKVDAEMRGMSQRLGGDPQLETTLRNRAQEMGIRYIGRDQTVDREMERQLTQSRSQSMGLER